MWRDQKPDEIDDAVHEDFIDWIINLSGMNNFMGALADRNYIIVTGEHGWAGKTFFSYVTILYLYNQYQKTGVLIDANTPNDDLYKAFKKS